MECGRWLWEMWELVVGNVGVGCGKCRSWLWEMWELVVGNVGVG